MVENDLMTTVVLALIMMFCVIMVVIWFFYMGQKKIMFSKMQQKENELAFQKILLLNTVKTQEVERERISSELHDDITSKLNIIHLNVHLIKRKIESDSNLMVIIDQIETSLTSSIERSRSISHELMPQIIKKFGIQHAIKELVNSINLTNKVKVSLYSEELINIKNDFKLLHIFRILQELINNSLKYASAENITFGFSQESQSLVLKYYDDGIGFDPEVVSEGLGLSNIRTRCELLNGNIIFGSYSEGHGMSVIIKFPNHD